DNYPIKNSGLDNETISNIHDKILKRTLYDKNDGNINADKWYEFHKKIKKGE
ncbi:DNA-binding protein, partial [Escherichia coli]|nr:DNA-binding protein [Escherichia coli]